MADFLKTYTQIEKYVEMTKTECEFLYNLILEKKPKKILEIGVSSGASSHLILNALGELSQDSTLYSVDISTCYYKDKSKSVGFLVSELNGSVPENWNLLCSGTSATFIEKISSGIDFVFLDAAHGIPGEVLDFLTVYPYCNDNVTFVLHDINIQFVQQAKTLSIAPKVLLSSITADKLYPKETEYEICNIAAFMPNKDTMKNIEDVFNALLFRWMRPMSSKQKDEFYSILAKNYDEKLVNYFDIAQRRFRYEPQKAPKKSFLDKFASIFRR